MRGTDPTPVVYPIICWSVPRTRPGRCTGAWHGPRVARYQNQRLASATHRRLGRYRSWLVRCRLLVIGGRDTTTGPKGLPDRNGFVDRATDHSPFTIFHSPLTILLPRQRHLFLDQKMANGAVRPRRDRQRSHPGAQPTTARFVEGNLTSSCYNR